MITTHALGSDSHDQSSSCAASQRPAAISPIHREVDLFQRTDRVLTTSMRLVVERHIQAQKAYEKAVSATRATGIIILAATARFAMSRVIHERANTRKAGPRFPRFLMTVLRYTDSG